MFTAALVLPQGTDLNRNSLLQRLFSWFLSDTNSISFNLRNDIHLSSCVLKRHKAKTRFPICVKKQGKRKLSPQQAMEAYKVVRCSVCHIV
jgi:hypothetical protein